MLKCFTLLHGSIFFSKEDFHSSPLAALLVFGVCFYWCYYPHTSRNCVVSLLRDIYFKVIVVHWMRYIFFLVFVSTKISLDLVFVCVSSSDELFHL